MHRTWAVLIWITAVAPVIARADFAPSSTTTARVSAELAAQPEPRSESRLGFGLDLDHFDFAEKSPAPERSTEKGTLLGYLIDAKLQPARQDAFVRARLDLSFSSTRFSGTTQSGIAVPDSDTTNQFIDAMLEAATPNFFPARGWSAPLEARLYVGMGIHNWQRGNPTDSAGSYREAYNWYYLPIGTRLEVTPVNWFSLGVDASARYTFGGTLDIEYSQVSTRPDLNANLGAKWGGRIEIPLTFSVTRQVQLIATPIYYEYSAIGESGYFYYTTRDANNQITQHQDNEPASRTYQYGSAAMLAVRL